MTQVQHMHKITPEKRKFLRFILIIPQFPIITRKIYTLDSLYGKSSDVVGKNLAIYMKAVVESCLSDGMFYTPPEILKPNVSSNLMSSLTPYKSLYRFLYNQIFQIVDTMLSTLQGGLWRIVKVAGKPSG